MRPTVSSLGQGPRLVVGMPRHNLVRVDTSAFSELQKPAKDPGPVVPGELPVRHVADVVKGLGLSYEAERDLSQAVQEWLDTSDPVQFRGRVIRGMRGFAPGNMALRSEVWRRAGALYRSRGNLQRRAPGSIVVQKSQDAPPPEVDGWEPMPGVSGGVRRPVQGGYEYRFPAADIAPEPPCDLSRIFQARPQACPPELLFCYPDDEAFQKGAPYIGPRGGKWADPQHTIPWVDRPPGPRREHVVDMIVGSDGGSLTLYQGNDESKMHTSPDGGSEYGIFLTPRRGYAQRYGDNVHRTWAKVGNPKIVDNKGEISPHDLTKLDVQKLESQGYDAIVSITPGRPIEEADEIILFRTEQLVPYGDTSAARRVKDAAEDRRIELGVEKSLQKAAKHKYLKRVPTGKQRPKYRYIYKLPQRKGLVVDEHLVAGAKLKVTHAGKLGHFEVHEHDEDRGLVKLKHDESGKTAWIRKRDLSRMLEAHHAKAGKDAARKDAIAPREKKAPPPKLQRAEMADLARGEWTEVVGFEPTAEAAQQLAQSLKSGWDYAAIKQPNGFMVVARKQAGKAKAARELSGAKVKVHMRNEKPLSASYVLMEADDIVASHNAVNFNVRKDYPEGVQEREYHRSKHEQGKVIRIAQKMAPEFVINNNPDGVNGTPIVTQDGEVLGGNARTMGIQRAYATEPGSAKKYRDYLTAHARDYGFAAADIRAMRAPVLVRKTRVDKAKFSEDGKLDTTRYNAHLRLLGRRMNEGMTQGLDPRAEEVALGKNFVDDRMLRALTDKVEEGESLDKFLQSERSRTFVKSLWAAGIIDEMNAGQFTYSDEAGADEGLLNKEGRARLERVLVGKLIDSPTLLDRMGPTQRQALANSVVHIVVAQQNGWDIVPQLKRAVQIDQSIQRIEKQLDAAGRPRLALKRFLSGKQKELPGVSSMADEVRRDPMLRNLLIVVREKAGTRTMPRDFLGFSLRAREDAKRNPALTGQADMFGGAFAAKREDPATALDIEFGVSPPEARAKKEREQQARQKAKQQEEQRKRIAQEKKQMGQASLLAASMGLDPPDLIKAAEPNRLVTRAIHHVEHLVDAAVSTSMLEHGEIRVDGAKIAQRVMADIDRAVRKDPGLAREQGRAPIDAKVVRGLIEAFCEIRGKSMVSA